MDKTNLTKPERARYSVLVRELSNMSHNGWAGARPCDYEPLERELKALVRKATGE